MAKDISYIPIENDLPDYQIQSVLGSGSTSTVYLATHLPLGRNVAIKRFSPDLLSKETDIAKRFQREAAMWARFSHENLIYLHDYRKFKGSQYIIMEYCHGIDLRKLMDHFPMLPLPVVAVIIYQLLNAIEYLHQHGIVHRDLKPANIFLKSDGVVKLMDFGISRSVEMDSMTLPGSIIGTPAYMSPEQAIGNTVDARTDLYSVGVMMFEMLDGRKPYRSETISDLIQEISGGSHFKFSKPVPTKWKNLVYRCMEYRSEERPESATEIRIWIEKFFLESNIQLPKRLLQDFMVTNEMISQETLYFPNQFAASIAKGSLKESYSIHSTHEFRSSGFPWFWMTFTIGFVVLLFFMFILYPEQIQQALHAIAQATKIR